MRTWGRIYPRDVGSAAIGSFVIGVSAIGLSDGEPYWQEVTTDAQGSNDEVYLTTLCQVLLLGLNESPFYGNFGIPAQQAVLSQLPPDYYVTATQQQFAQFFASLVISRRSSNPPTYDISVVTHQGVRLSASVAIPA